MQDIAGTRIAAEMDRNEQDGMVKRLVGLFPDSAVVDRRVNPSSGYRAIHVVAREYGYPVEIQVRTGLQNAWAQVFERLADILGRQIRYGEPPDNSDEEFVTGLTRQMIVDFSMQLSERIDQFEASAVMVKETEHELEEQKRRLEEAKAGLQTVEGELRDFFGHFGPLVQARRLPSGDNPSRVDT